ncbi:M20 family metallopeptidase [Actinomycetota bacterium]
MSDLKTLKNKVVKEVENMRPKAIEMSDYIFDNPELSQEEFKTVECLEVNLKEHGFSFEKKTGGLETAFKAEFSTGKPGPTIAFIAEYDALPKMGHSCHHNIIAASSVYTAVALSKLKDDLRGNIVVLGTPAEEWMDAKGMMIKAGAFKDIDACLMFHGGERNNTKLIVLAVDGLEFIFKGKAAHAAAAPHEGINALDAVILLFNAINALRQQLKDDVRIHGNVIKGGDAVNIIPEIASARFYIRAQQRKYLNEVIEKIKDCARGAELQTGAKLEISIFEDPGNDLLRNETLISEFENNFIEIGGKLDSEPFLLGSSDIGNLSYNLPVLHPMVQTAEKGTALHTDKMLEFGKSDFAHKGMMSGMKAVAMTAIKAFMDDDFLGTIKKEFEEKTKNGLKFE